MKNLTSIIGKQFRSPITDETYGLIHEHTGEYPEGFEVELYGVPFAYDSVGNYFTENGSKEICFWHHETDEVEVIATSWSAFYSECTEPSPVSMDGVVIDSVWIDPEFAKQMDIEVPPDGWKKKPT